MLETPVLIASIGLYYYLIHFGAQRLLAKGFALPEHDQGLVQGGLASSEQIIQRESLLTNLQGLLCLKLLMENL